MTNESGVVNQLSERRAEWVERANQLQTRAQGLSRELNQVQEQLVQLSGAIQACDVLLKDAGVDLTASQPSQVE